MLINCNTGTALGRDREHPQSFWSASSWTAVARASGCWGNCIGTVWAVSACRLLQDCDRPESLLKLERAESQRLTVRRWIDGVVARVKSRDEVVSCCLDQNLVVAKCRRPTTLVLTGSSLTS
jgi:hypothetical protein